MRYSMLIGVSPPINFASEPQSDTASLLDPIVACEDEDVDDEEDVALVFKVNKVKRRTNMMEKKTRKRMKGEMKIKTNNKKKYLNNIRLSLKIMVCFLHGSINAHIFRRAHEGPHGKRLIC